jgi:spore coat protein YutH
MKDTIIYNYNLDIDDIEEQDGKYYFKLDNKEYFFVFFNRDIIELDDIITILNYMQEHSIQHNKLILNVHNTYLTKVGDYNYILIESTNPLEEYDIFDLIDFQKKLVLNPSNSKLYRNNWQELWSEKIDYFEYQMQQLGISKEIVPASISYYIGLSENAISYVSMTNKNYYNNDFKLVLSHRRIYYPNYKLNFLNPLSFIFDLSIRDIAEYIKSIFFADEEVAFQELSCYLKINKLSIYEYHMLFARFLYPSFYFDIYEKVMNKDESEEKLISIISKSKAYEKFLKKIYLEISKYTYLTPIAWLTN